MPLLTDSSPLRRLIAMTGDELNNVDDMMGTMSVAYRDLASPLPDGHPWKKQAHENSLRMRDHVLASHERFGTTRHETRVLALLAYTHGLGRLVDSTNRKERYPEAAKAGHGALAASEFATIAELPEENLNPFWRAALYAIQHRTDPAAPPKPDTEDGFAAARHELLGILRDIVMYDGLVPERIRAKLENREEKDRLRMANWTNAKRSEDPLLGLERGEILPKSQLLRFTKHEALVRSEYESYETLMLETLSYVFKFATPAMAELAIRAGGPSLVLRYLQRQLQDEDEFQKIKNALFRWNDRFAILILEG